MEDKLMELGVGGIFALLVLQTVVPFIKRKNGNNCSDQTMQVMHNELKTLIATVNDNISAQTGILRDLCREIRKIKP